VRSTILVVEDDAAVRRVLTLLLELDGHRVLAAHDVPSALALAQSHRGVIDLLVTDIVLPGGGASALLEGLDALGRSLPVLYLSGSPRPESGGLPERPSLFLAKPFVPDRLSDAVHELLGR